MTDMHTAVVLLTGAAGGIGRELAWLFSSRGAAIAALDKNPQVTALVSELQHAGFRAEAQIADIGSAAAVAEAVSKLSTALGTISVLINNAGFSSQTSLADTAPDSWQHDVQCNLNGSYFVTSSVLPAMQARRAGAIVNIASVNGLSALGDPAYSAAKAGMISLSKSVALEYGKFGIRCNTICPGTVRTPIWAERMKRNPEIMEQLRRWYPLGRVVEPKEIAKAALFLASEDASAISGAVLPVDCGLSAGNVLMTTDLTAGNPAAVKQ